VIKTDGFGVKTGLTAVEAAVVLGKDWDTIITMILYGLCRKEVIAVKSQNPLEFEIADPVPAGLNDYEKGFIRALKDPDRRNEILRDTLRNLTRSVYQKMEGYSLADTKAHYRKICEKALKQVQDAKTADVKSSMLGTQLNWIMLADSPEKKISTVVQEDEEFAPPSWWWRKTATARPASWR